MYPLYTSTFHEAVCVWTVNHSLGQNHFRRNCRAHSCCLLFLVCTWFMFAPIMVVYIHMYICTLIIPGPQRLSCNKLQEIPRSRGCFLFFPLRLNSGGRKGRARPAGGTQASGKIVLLLIVSGSFWARSDKLYDIVHSMYDC